jgi:hypothetical protein
MADDNKTFEEKWREYLMGVDYTTPGYDYLKSYVDKTGWELGSLKPIGGNPNAQFPMLKKNAPALSPLTMKTATSLPKDQWGPFANYSLNKITDLANQRLWGPFKKDPSEMAYAMMYDTEALKQYTPDEIERLKQTSVQDFENQAVMQAQNYQANPYRQSLYGMPLGILADEQAAIDSGMTIAERVEEGMIDLDDDGQGWE